MKIYALDIGGSSLKQALINVNAMEALIVKGFPPLQLSTNLFSDLREIVVSVTEKALRVESDISTVAISTTGNVDETGLVRRAGHFDGYENVSWQDILCSKFTRISRVITVNDGKASTWAEYTANNACTSFAHIVVGTGIGGGIVINGALLHGSQGAAGSFGHIKVCEESDIHCSCTRVGCVETVASAPAIVRAFKRKSQDQDTPEPKNFKDITLLAKTDDVTAKEVFREAGTWLGVALSDVMNILNPQIVTIGGGVVLAAESISQNNSKNIFLDAAIRSAESLALRRVAATTLIQRAKYGNDGGLVGAALLAAKK